MTLRLPLTRTARDFLTALDGLQKERLGEPIHTRTVEEFLGIDPFQTALAVRELIQADCLSVPSLLGERGWFTEHTTEPILFTKVGRAYLERRPIPDDPPPPPPTFHPPTERKPRPPHARRTRQRIRRRIRHQPPTDR